MALPSSASGGAPRSPRSRRRSTSYPSRRLLVVFATAGVAALLYFQVLLPRMQWAAPPARSSPRVTTDATRAGPHCASARLGDAARLGEVAWVDDGALRVVDLGTCQQRTLVATGAEPPVRFSPDGGWLAFGQGRVVPAAGGRVQLPLGLTVQPWAWSPTTDLLAGVTRNGGVLIGRPGEEPEIALPDGSGVGHLAFAPDGRRLAIDRAERGVQVLDLSMGRARTVLPEPDPAQVPEVAGWSPDGRWVLYWRAPVHENGSPLDAVPASGGPWANVFDPVLPYPDVVAACGDRIAVSVGEGRAVTVGKQIVLTGPPAWSYDNVTGDFSRSWFWPACSPDGRWLAASDSFSQKEAANATIPRALWLLATDGSSRRILVAGTQGAVEFPRWSSDGSTILVVLRSGDRWSSPGSLYLVPVKRSNHPAKLLGPIADLGSAPGPGGLQGWAETSDWYRPGS